MERRRRQRAARRNRRQLWCLGLVRLVRCRLTPKEAAAAAAATEATCARHATVCDGVECVFAFPVGRRAIGRVGARRFDATGVSNHA